MSFLSAVSNLFQSIGTASNLVQHTVALVKSFNTNQLVTNNVVKPKEMPGRADPETAPTQITLMPDPLNKIPVLYGRGITKGVLFDATTSNQGRVLWLAYALSEVTGNKLDGTPSEINLQRVFVNGYQAQFDADGRTVGQLIGPRNSFDNSVAGLIRVYYFKNGSANPARPLGYPAGAFPGFPGNLDPLQDARQLMPSFRDKDIGRNLAFAIVRLTYNQFNGLTQVPEFSFDLQNTMDDPGDCLFDYLTNIRYGAGIPPEEIDQ
jgi:hypothetical protein